VGYRRPRQAEEYAGVKKMSETCYVRSSYNVKRKAVSLMVTDRITQIFQRIWSDRVINERSAWKLLSLIDQIHLWAITEFRAFVIEHLRPWHKFCGENYLLDWDSAYDCGQQRKRKRTFSEGGHLPLPSWVGLLSETQQQKVQIRAKESLAKALEEHRLRKGKAKYLGGRGLVCMLEECSRFQEAKAAFGSAETWLDHVQCFHECEERDLAKIKRCLDQPVEERFSDNVPASFIENDPGPSKRVRVI
jgi:hypothetical protein